MTQQETIWGWFYLIVQLFVLPTLLQFANTMLSWKLTASELRFTLYLDSGLFQSEDCNQYTNEQMHTHPYYEWFFVTNGSMRLTTAEQTIVLKKNDFVIIRPGVGHYINFLQDGTTRYNLNFAFEHNGLDSVENLHAQLQARFGQNACVFGAGTQELADINRRISQLCGTNRRTMICACFAQLITCVQDLLGDGPVNIPIEEFLRDESTERRERIRKLFFQRFPNSDIPFNYRLGLLGKDAFTVSAREAEEEGN